MQESLAAEHGGELLGDALEELLDGGGVTDEGGGHLEATWWDVTDGGLDVVRDPLNKVGGVLVLDVEHLLVDLLHRHTATEHGGNSEVANLAISFLVMNVSNYGMKLLTVRDVDHMQPSCSWRRTSVKSTLER